MFNTTLVQQQENKAGDNHEERKIKSVHPWDSPLSQSISSNSQDSPAASSSTTPYLDMSATLAHGQPPANSLVKQFYKELVRQAMEKHAANRRHFTREAQDNFGSELMDKEFFAPRLFTYTLVNSYFEGLPIALNKLLDVFKQLAREHLLVIAPTLTTDKVEAIVNGDTVTLTEEEQQAIIHPLVRRLTLPNLRFHTLDGAIMEYQQDYAHYCASTKFNEAALDTSTEKMAKNLAVYMQASLLQEICPEFNPNNLPPHQILFVLMGLFHWEQHKDVQQSLIFEGMTEDEKEHTYIEYAL